MLERMTQWLAGERAEDLVPSYFGFNAPFPVAVCLALIAGTVCAVALYYWRKLDGLATRTRVFLVATRVTFVTLVLFLALDPSIVAQRIKPGEQFVLLLFDDSESMRIVGEDGQSRGERLIAAYGAAADPFEKALRRKHQIARYRLGAGIEPLQRVADLKFNQQDSDLTGGVVQALRDMEGAHVSAVVLFSDGVHQTSYPAPAVEDLPNTPPVFTVGVDTESNWRDIELGTLSVKRTEFDKSPVIVKAGVNSTGLAGREAEVQVLLDRRVIQSKTIQIAHEHQEQEVTLQFIPDRKDWIEYTAQVALKDPPLAPGQGPAVFPRDRVVENNSRSFIVDNRDKSYRILYFSGRPNWEHKFIRAAMEEDKQLRLTSLICISTAERKFEFRGRRTSTANPLFEGLEEDQDRPRYDQAVFIRLGADETELISGYPATAEELFKYDLIMLGDVERDFFTMAQLEATRDFVERRGGALLMLGGPQSFTEGGYNKSLIEAMLPVILFQDYDDRRKLRTKEFFTVKPTVEGALAGSWSFDTDPLADGKLWEELPPLYGLDQFPLTRPGANVMAEAKSDHEGVEGRPFFITQRYGEGTTAILATSDTWQWQMRLDENDDRHGRLWRQIVRHLVHKAPKPAFLRDKADSYSQGAEAVFEFIVRDNEFHRREGLRTSVTVTAPSKTEHLLSVEESIQEMGLYVARFTPDETGLHRIRLNTVNDKEEVIATLDEAFLVAPDHRELQLAQYNPAFLDRLAQRTGGRRYALDQLSQLAERIPVPARDDAEQVLLHLWHLPGFYVALVVMMAAEWYVRRRKGRA